MDKQNSNKRSLERTLSGSFDLCKENAKKQKLEEEASQAKQDHTISDKFTGPESSKGVIDSKGKGILKQDLAIKSIDIKGEDIMIGEDKKLQMLSDQGKSENAENQRQTALEKRENELNRESKQLALRWEHLMDNIREQAQFLGRAEKDIWESNELTLEQKRKHTHLLEMNNKEYVRTMQSTGQYLIGRLYTVANEQSITNHLKKRSEDN